MVDEFEVEFFLASAGSDIKVEGNHCGRGAELSDDGGEMVAGDGADGAADVDDFRGGERGGEGGDNTAAGHGKGHVSEA